MYPILEKAALIISTIADSLLIGQVMGVPKSVVTVFVGILIFISIIIATYLVTTLRMEGRLKEAEETFNQQLESNEAEKSHVEEENRRLRGRHNALLNLYREGKVHTINYVLGLEDLEKGSGGRSKKQDLEVADIKFTFKIDNKKNNMSGSCTNVKYWHTLRLTNQSARQRLHADFLILHAYGGLDNVRFLFDGKQKSALVKPVPEIISQIPVNQRLARCSATPDWNTNHGVGKLEFGYDIAGEHNMNNTLESFVIIPKNYAKSIEAGMEFRIDYMEDPTKTNGNVGIELRKLSMETSTPNMELVCNAGVTNGGKRYTCIVPHEDIDMTCIYFLLIKYDKKYSPDTKEAP